MLSDDIFEILLRQDKHSIVTFDFYFGITMHQAGKGQQARSKRNKQHFLLLCQINKPQ